MADENLETITLAGGCFWCTEAIFKRIRGVISTMPGYSGGFVENPTYEEVRSGKTGHAEAIQIEYDPKIISLRTLLRVFFKLHNPTTVNRQGVDIGTQYRSVIFYRDEKQKNVALRVKAEIDKSGLYKNRVVTEIEAFKNFYNAEDYHQNYYDNNKNALYCRLIIDPKIKKLFDGFGELTKS